MSLSRYYDYNSFDRLFDTLISDFPLSRVSKVKTYVGDVRTEENLTNLSVEMPGVSTDDLKVTVKDHILEVSGKSRTGKEHSYSYYLNPSLHDENNITATLRDGLLELKVEHLRKAQPKTIKVTSV